MSEKLFNLTVEEDYFPRADLYIAKQLSLSRSQLQKRICEKKILINNKKKSISTPVMGGDILIFSLADKPEISLKPQKIPLHIIHEDENVIVINKQSGLTVHAGGGALDNTLVNALLYYSSNLEGFKDNIRPGIVHRLDKDTSGVIITAKNETSLEFLQKQFAARSVGKLYHALISPPLKNEITEVNKPIGRDPHDRKKMAVEGLKAREAQSVFTIEKTLKKSQLISARIHTGRTHQIRVHLKFLNSPVLGDTIYGIKTPFKPKRLMLHASELKIVLPGNTAPSSFKAPLPEEMANFIEKHQI